MLQLDNDITPELEKAIPEQVLEKMFSRLEAKPEFGEEIISELKAVILAKKYTAKDLMIKILSKSK